MTLFQEGNTVSNNKLIFPVALKTIIINYSKYNFKQYIHIHDEISQSVNENKLVGGTTTWCTYTSVDPDVSENLFVSIPIYFIIRNKKINENKLVGGTTTWGTIYGQRNITI